MPIKPSSKPAWTVGNPSFGTVTQEPTSGEKQTGWSASMRPPFQWMNWLFWNIHQWIKYFEDLTDEISSGLAAFEQAQEIPVGTVDGTNGVFTLTEAPYNAAALLLFVNSRLVPRNDYTLVNQTITFGVGKEPEIGSDIHAQYTIQRPFIGIVPNSAPLGTTPKTEIITVTAPMVAAKAVTLNQAPYDPVNSDLDLIDDGNEGFFGIDYTIVGTTLSWAGLGLDDGSIVAGERLKVRYFV